MGTVTMLSIPNPIVNIEDKMMKLCGQSLTGRVGPMVCSIAIGITCPGIPNAGAVSVSGSCGDGGDGSCCGWPLAWKQQACSPSLLDCWRNRVCMLRHVWPIFGYCMLPQKLTFSIEETAAFKVCACVKCSMTFTGYTMWSEMHECMFATEMWNLKISQSLSFIEWMVLAYSYTCIITMAIC